MKNTVVAFGVTCKLTFWSDLFRNLYALSMVERRLRTKKKVASLGHKRIPKM